MHTSPTTLLEEKNTAALAHATLVHKTPLQVCDAGRPSLLRRTPSSLVRRAGGGRLAVHPIHTEAVASAVGMAELLMAAFGLAAAHLIIKRRQQAGPAGRVGLGPLLGFLVLGWAACFSKETGSTLVRLLMKRTCGRLSFNIKHY